MNKKEIKNESKRPTFAPSSFYLEGERSASGMSIIFGGVIGISDYSEEKASLTSHAGRIHISGSGITLSIYENKTVEIVGKIEEIRFEYARS